MAQSTWKSCNDCKLRGSSLRKLSGVSFSTPTALECHKILFYQDVVPLVINSTQHHHAAVTPGYLDPGSPPPQFPFKCTMIQRKMAYWYLCPQCTRLFLCINMEILAKKTITFMDHVSLILVCHAINDLCLSSSTLSLSPTQDKDLPYLIKVLHFSSSTSSSSFQMGVKGAQQQCQV